MRKLMIVPVFAAIALGGCGAPSGSNAAAENAAVAPEPANAGDMEANAAGNQIAGNALATVLGMNDGQRNAVFVRALMDAGLPCDGVTSSERLPDQEGKPLWRANCRPPGGSHLIAITPDGIAQIVSRSDR